MLDAKLRPLIDPPLDAAGRWIARRGVGPNTVTLLGLLPGLAAAFAIAHGRFELGLGLVLLNRLLDGLDGAVARATRQTDFGGYLDIVADFAFYVAVPTGFGFAAAENAVAAMVLIAAFTLTGVSFLAYATLAAKRGVETRAHGHKSFFYNTGLAEGTETIVVFVLMCLRPSQFALFAWVYAGLCLVTVVQRSALARATFRSDKTENEVSR